MNTTVEDGVLKKVVAPENEASKEATIDETKARILGEKAEEGRDQEMSSYKTKQLVTSLSEKADDAITKVPGKEANEPEKNDVKKASEDEEGDELVPSRLIALERMKNHAEQRKTGITIKFKTEDLGGSLNKGKSGILRKGVKFKDEDLKETEDPKRFSYTVLPRI